jgi:hypothetical protein
MMSHIRFVTPFTNSIPKISHVLDDYREQNQNCEKYYQTVFHDDLPIHSSAAWLNVRKKAQQRNCANN